MLKIALVSALAVSSLGVFAQSKKPDTKPGMIHCAVQTGNLISIKKATNRHMFADYKGNRYFFCCNGCPQAFKANPAKYAKGDHIATPKAEKKMAAKTSQHGAAKAKATSKSS